MNIKLIQKKKKIIRFKFSYINKINILIKYYLLIILFPNYLSKSNEKIKNINLLSEIIITIKGIGDQNILDSSSPVPIPDEILINGVYQSERSKTVYNLENEINNITMRWNDPFISCANMFKELTNITNIYFTDFDTSQIKDMSYMFSQTSITSLDLSKFNTSSVENFGDMFRKCYFLTSLDLRNFDTSKASAMRGMFHSCKSLNYLNVKNFNTSSVTNMKSFFYSCSSLKKLDIRSFDTSLVTNMNCMFWGCSSLTTLNLKNFRTPYVVDMGHLFEGCSSLISLNLDNFDTSKNKDFSLFFYNCHALISLNLNSFNTISSTNDNSVFYGLNPNVIFTINEETTRNYYELYKGFNISSSNICFEESTKLLIARNECIYDCNNEEIYNLEFEDICYKDCPDDTHLIYNYNNICFEELEGYYLDTIDNRYKPCYPSCKECYGSGDEDNNNCIECISDYKFITKTSFNNCYMKCDNYYYFNNSNNYICTPKKECPNDYNKLIEEKSECIDNCTKDDIYIYEYNNQCYQFCPDQTFVTSDNVYLCQQNPEGYYLDNNIYKPCYKGCKSCFGNGDENNNNCIECRSNYNSISGENEKNCYEKCEYYYYFDSSGKYSCTEKDECPKEVSKLIKLKGKCIDNCINDDLYKYEENNICIKYSPKDNSVLICPINLPYEKARECVQTCKALEFLMGLCIINNKNNQTVQFDIIRIIKEELEKGEKGELNPIISKVKDKREDHIVQDEDSIYEVTSSYNQENYEYDNISSIILGDCERKLRDYYLIDDNEDLLIFKTDKFEEGLHIPIIEYEIYHPLTLEKLNLSICEDTKIGLSIPVNINESILYKYNSSHEYYNDVCYTYTTETGTDYVVKDRQIEYVDKNLSLCESKCDYVHYNTSNKKVLCQCKPKISSVSLDNENNDRLLIAFKELRNAINLEVMKCYKKVFCKDGLIKNIGSYILLFIISAYIFLAVLFKVKGFKVIHNMIQDLVKRTFNIEFEKKEMKEIANDKNIMDNNNFSIYQNNNNIPKNTKNIKFKKKKKLKKKKVKKKSSQNVNPPKRNIIFENNNCLGENENMPDYDKKLFKNSEKIGIGKNILKKPLFDDKNTNPIIHNKNKFYCDYELDKLEYEKALEYDKRAYCQYYISLLKQKHLILFTFYAYNDYNSQIIKICLFLFSFALYYTVNALFFNYTTMNRIYVDKGSYNLLHQLPQIIFSTIISGVISMIIKTLSLTQKNILELKNETDNINIKVSNLLSCIIMKFILFFILSFLFLIFFWYYLACFCAIYSNTQGHLIKDTLISLFLSMLYPLLIYLIPGCFRIMSLRAINKDKILLYKISKIIQLI